ncbi:MAG: DUF5591 domain-containing protein [Candidatus Aenigmarchaeota archaeon]|nr:DUF5591 domain-containing protein [Candidatus Aenigmarchaeota archaeon]
MEELVIVLPSGKCEWGGCVFCGWGRMKAKQKTIRELKEFFDSKLKGLKAGELERLKVFCSGCFLDPKQVVPAFRSYLVRKCEQLCIKSLIVESFPKFITDENLENMRSNKVKILAGIGLEVADDAALKRINKGFTLEEFEKASEVCKRNGWGIRAYLLVNCPGAENLLKKSVEYAKKWSEEVILINCLPHYAAPIMQFYVTGKWKPFNEKEFIEATKEFDVEKDFQNFSFRPMFPDFMREKIRGAGEKQLLHPHFRIWQEFFRDFYKPKKDKDILLFVPCSFRKPYTASHLHKAIDPVLTENIQRVVVSTPGVVPIEYCNDYPFNSYDWPEWEETKEIKQKYIDVTEKRVEDFLRAHAAHYKKILCYLKPDTESFKAVMLAAEKLGIKVESCIREEVYESFKDEKNPLAHPLAVKELERVVKKL